MAYMWIGGGRSDNIVIPDKGVDTSPHGWQTNAMDKTTPRQRDIDRRLRDATGLGLTDWMAKQRQSKTSYRSMSRLLDRITGDSVSDQTLRVWFRISGVEVDA